VIFTPLSPAINWVCACPFLGNCAWMIYYQIP